MVASHKAFVADRTGEAFLSRVGSQMSLQLVRSGEAFAAEQPVTNERPLASVPPQVCLEVRSLAVDLTAARDVTAVEALPPKAGSAGPRRSASWQLGQSQVALPEYRREDLAELPKAEGPEIMELAVIAAEVESV